MRVCKTCGDNKDISEFFKKKQSKDGISLHCKDCDRLNHNLWHEKYKTKNINEFSRCCSICNKILHYKTKIACKNANIINSLCTKCAAKKRGTPISFLKNQVKGYFSGENNPFYGKEHTDMSKEKMRKNANYAHVKTKEFKEKISKSTKGSKNPMFGKSVYSVWVKKHGVEKANEMQVELNQKIRIKAVGKNNPMYGKSTPTGSGNGWSGWYGDFYFRSLKELSYVIELDKQQIKWYSAENIKIKYKNYDGSDRTYCPDFLVGNHLIEIKPKKLWSSRSVQIKQNAAIDYCQSNNLLYKLIDPLILSTEEIVELRTTGKIKFIDRYEEKFQNKYGKINTAHLS